MQNAPIALFTYNRADHTQKAIESLLQNAEAKDSELFIFSDGPKNEKSFEGVKKNREYIHDVKKMERVGFKTVTVIERKHNMGLSKSLIMGITEIVDKYGKVIVVEDDLILSNYFLRYMNEALEKYKDEERVASISGFLNPIDKEVKNNFFLRYFACWGWATWKRGWDLLINDDKTLLRRLRWKKNDFNIGGTGPFYGILYCNKVCLNDSWAVRFYASQFLADKLQLFPKRTLVLQNGTDGSGTHSGGGPSVYDNMILSRDYVGVEEIPIEESKKMYALYSEFYRSKQNYNVITFHYERFKSFIRRLLGIDYR